MTDVNKCRYFPKEQCTVELMDCVTCIYKKAQQLQEENEELKEQLQDTYEQRALNEHLLEVLQQKLEENEELRRSKDAYYLQNLTDEKTISDLLTENKELKEWKEANKATGICETCTEESVKELDKLRQENKSLRNSIYEIGEDREAFEEAYYEMVDKLKQYKIDFAYAKFAKVKLQKIEDRIQDLDNCSENNVEIMNDILQIIRRKND